MAFFSNVYVAFTQVVILFLVAMVGFVCHKTGIYTEKASRFTVLYCSSRHHYPFVFVNGI